MAPQTNVPSSSITTRPERPAEVDWKAAVLDKTNGFLDDACKSTDPEVGQKAVAAIDGLLQVIANVQVAVGEARRKASAHVGKLRTESPKGRPAEGTVRELKGKTYVFEKGRYWPIEVSPPSDEGGQAT